MTDAAGRNLLVGDLFGANFVALGLDHDPAAHFSTLPTGFPLRCIRVAHHHVPPADRSAARERPVPAHQTLQLTDHTGRLAVWFEEKRVTVAILRPDRFVFAAYSMADVDQPARELASLLG